MNDISAINKFSSYLFWDVDSASIDMDANAPYVIQRVLEFGQLSDWKLIVSFYGLSRIVSIAQNFRTLEPKALSFICTISSTPKESFRCYSQKHSTRGHWLY